MYSKTTSWTSALLNKPGYLSHSFLADLKELSAHALEGIFSFLSSCLKALAAYWRPRSEWNRVLVLGALGYGHAQGRQGGRLGEHGLADRPADDLAVSQVYHGGQVEPAFQGREIGDIGDPGPVDFSRLKGALKQIGRNGQNMIRVRGAGDR